MINDHHPSNMTDLPLSPKGKDSLGAEDYVDALTTFVSKVKTPMAISIQGPWGSGKTSFMYHLAARTCLNVDTLYPWEEEGSSHHNDSSEGIWVKNSGSQATQEQSKVDQKKWMGVWVNTWQYSLLRDDGSAQIEILKGTIDSLNEAVKGQVDRFSESIQTLTKTLGKSFKEIVIAGAKVGMASAGLNPRALENLDNIFIDEPSGGPQKFRKTLIELIKHYKQEIKKRVLDFKGFIFFVDDMDRLEPVVAVEILSILKNLFDSPDCVFIIAVDYDVVIQGLEKRFGKREEAGNNGTVPGGVTKPQANDRAFRQYFDKMIQLTFRVPTSQLDLKPYLQELLKRIDFLDEKYSNVVNDTNSDFLKSLEAIVSSTCGKNPRAIKRLINNLSLVKELVLVRDNEGKDEKLDPKKGLLLLAALSSMQAVYPKAYEYILENPDPDTWWTKEKDPEGGEDYETVQDEIINKDPWYETRIDDIDDLLTRIQELANKIKGSNKIETSDIIINYTTFTSATAASTTDTGKRTKKFGTLEAFLAKLSDSEGYDKRLEKDFVYLVGALKQIIDSSNQPYNISFIEGKSVQFSLVPERKFEVVGIVTMKEGYFVFSAGKKNEGPKLYVRKQSDLVIKEKEEKEEVYSRTESINGRDAAIIAFRKKLESFCKNGVKQWGQAIKRKKDVRVLKRIECGKHNPN